jgi:hypothetical protein
MFRLLSLAAVFTLLLLLVCGAHSHHTAHHPQPVDRLEAPTAIAMPSGLESLPDSNSTFVLPGADALVFTASRLSSVASAVPAPRDPLAISSVLRI